MTVLTRQRTSFFFSLWTRFFANSLDYDFMTVGFLFLVSTHCPPTCHGVTTWSFLLLALCDPISRHWLYLSVLTHLATARGPLTVPHLVRFFLFNAAQIQKVQPVWCLLLLHRMVSQQLSCCFTAFSNFFCFFFLWLITIFWILFILNLGIFYFVLLSILLESYTFFSV